MTQAMRSQHVPIAFKTCIGKNEKIYIAASIYFMFLKVKTERKKAVSKKPIAKDFCTFTVLKFAISQK